MRLLQELSTCLLTSRTGMLGRSPQSRAIAPKKWPASVDLQAFKKSKGLQEQQSRCQFNTMGLCSLTISTRVLTLLDRMTINRRARPQNGWFLQNKLPGMRYEFVALAVYHDF